MSYLVKNVLHIKSHWNVEVVGCTKFSTHQVALGRREPQFSIYRFSGIFLLNYSSNTPFASENQEKVVDHSGFLSRVLNKTLMFEPLLGNEHSDDAISFSNVAMTGCCILNNCNKFGRNPPRECRRNESDFDAKKQLTTYLSKYSWEIIEESIREFLNTKPIHRNTTHRQS